MAETPEAPAPPPATEPAPVPGTPPAATPPKRKAEVHEVVFTTYPKLLFVWPLIVTGLLFWPLGGPVKVAPATSAPATAAVTTDAATLTAPPVAPARAYSGRLEVLGWLYIWIAIFVLMTLGVDVDRNQAIFWVVFFGAIWLLGLRLESIRGFTLFGDVYRWFAGLDVQYDRNLGFVLSVILLVPYLLMLGWARINDRWRITHNEFEHYSLGKMDDSLGRGAKTIRTSYPDVFELLLGLAGTLIIFNATGTKELRRIPHVMFLPFVRQRLNKILERTAITAGQMEEEEEEDDSV